MNREALNVFCVRLKEARLAKGFSQKGLGIKAGLDEFTASIRINRYELGVHKVELSFASKLADVLEVPLAYFYIEDDVLAELILNLVSLSDNQKFELLKHVKKLAESQQ